MLQDGYNHDASIMSLVRQYMMECEGKGDVTLPKETLNLILDSYMRIWHVIQDGKTAKAKK